MAKNLKIIPLGGLGEVGKNMMAVQYGKQFILIDAGLKFPDEEMPGIDLVLPDYTFVKNNQDNLLGIIITHGHEDHVGALPYLLKEINTTIYGTKLTLGLIKAKLKEYRIKDVRTKEITPGTKFNLGTFKIEFIRVSHSIPDGVALAIDTPIGKIVHSGDFKFDQTPIDGKLTDFSNLAALGKEKVLALMSDSTNAEASGLTLPEKSVGQAINEIFYTARRRIIVASFASHIHRIQQVINIAARFRKKVVVSGRSMTQNIGVASELGYLKIPDNLLIDVKDINKYKPHQIVILSTGSQGEPLSSLSRMAAHSHRFIQIEPGDSVIISATPIPGNETSVYRTINLLFKAGAEVFYEKTTDIHVSGHACAEELKMMLNFIKPKYFIPIHGEIRHLKKHARIAEDIGIPRKNIFIMENGDVLELDQNERCRKNGKVDSGIILVDGLGVGDIGTVILRDRQQLSRDGICIVVVGINVTNGKLVSGPDISCKGFVHIPASETLIYGAKQCVIDSINKSSADKTTEWAILKNQIKDVLHKYFYKEVGRRPMVIPVIMEV